jgi:putative hemolysin
MKKALIILGLLIVAVSISVLFKLSSSVVHRSVTEIANPASQYCVNNGGKLEIRTDPTGGQIGFCIFDNNECEEWAYFRGECKKGTADKNNEEVFCTMDAKLCPDGSYVGRVGPKCEFSTCPAETTKKNSGVRGTVELGPVCPVERIPPDPRCAPKPYSTLINIVKPGSNLVITPVQSDSNGAFSISLDPGIYTLQAKGGDAMPRCSSVSVEVKKGQYSSVTILCDTGIR